MARKATNDRKDQIIEITRDLIFNEGFSNFTVRTVAGKVGISEAAIYKHYSSKEELLMALLDSLFLPWQKTFKKIAARDVPVCERLLELAETHIDFLTEKKLNPLLFFSEAINPANTQLLGVLKKNLGFFSELVVELLKEGCKTDELRSDLEISSATACFIGTIQASVIKWTVFQTADDLKSMTMKNISFFLNCIQITGGGENGRTRKKIK